MVSTNHGSSSPNFRGDLKLSDQNNWGRGTSKKLNLGGAKFKGEPKILGGVYDNMVGKGVIPPPFLRSPLPLSRNLRCSHLS